MKGFVNCLVDTMCRYIGQTVTIFTTSGGLSGSGFTGVLLAVDINCVRLLADIGAPPACVGGTKLLCRLGYRFFFFLIVGTLPARMPLV